MSFDDMAMAVFFVAAALAILTIVFAVVFSRLYRLIWAKAEAHGTLIGELREMRRRQKLEMEMQERVEERCLREIIQAGEFHEKELDV